jgi:hypothetical protein
VVDTLLPSRRGNAGKCLEEAASITFGTEDAAHLVTARPVSIETPVLELDARAVLALGDEAQLDLGPGTSNRTMTSAQLINQIHVLFEKVPKRHSVVGDRFYIYAVMC